jgi:parallel beta-helix repeat protein
MNATSLILVFVAVLVVAPMTHAVEPVVFHVSPDGNDSWSGRLERPSGDGNNGPFLTIYRAQQAARALPREDGHLLQPVEVIIQDGIYFLAETLTFTQSDSGSAAAPVTYKAAPGANPVISGGTKIDGWEEITHEGLDAWQVTIPGVKSGDVSIRQLFVDGVRRPRPRLPEEGLFMFTDLPDVTETTRWGEGQTRAEFKPGDLDTWKNLGDVEIVALHLWSDSRLPIESVDVNLNIVKFQKKSRFRLSDDSLAQGVRKGCRYYVENVFEALDTPGEWYLDRSTGALTYLPVHGEAPHRTLVVAPRLRELVRFQPRVKYIRLEGLTFSHMEWSLPEEVSGSPQAETAVPGAVIFEDTTSCALDRCEVSHVAGYGVEFLKGCTNNSVVRCRLTDLGAGGVKIGHGSSRTLLADNVIEDGGVLYHAGVGVWIGHSGNNTVIHNEIARLYYSGVSVGWIWGYKESQAVRNRIEYNHIHDIGHGLLSDMGGIYTLGPAPGTTLRFNRIHDIESYRYGGWGIYPDEGSSNILIENNLVYRTKSAGFHQHYGKENTVRNNIFAFGGEAQVMRTRAEEHLMFSFHNNIVLSDNGRIIKGKEWNQTNADFDSNLYYDVNGNELGFSGMSFSDWQAKGFDKHSLVADPDFISWKKDMFEVKRGSPAFHVGFQEFDVSTAGPRR